MVLSIKSDRVDRLARELAALTGLSLTDALESALVERLARERRRRRPVGIDDIVARFAALEVIDARSPEQIIGYDDAGLPT